jgi:hypothetical protein
MRHWKKPTDPALARDMSMREFYHTGITNFRDIGTLVGTKALPEAVSYVVCLQGTRKGTKTG